MRKSQSGFTLVEIAIVLVIIGLLLGGVLKGQELINSAKVRGLISDLEQIRTATYMYQERFRALPGDDAGVVNHLGAASGAVLATTPNGTVGNGRIDGDWNSGTASDEAYLFWQHVRIANMLSGTTNTAAADYPPNNVEGGRLGITGVSPIAGWAGSIFVCSGNLTGRMARQIDIRLDDGVSDTGSVRWMLGNNIASGAAVLNANVQDAAVYTLCIAY